MNTKWEKEFDEEFGKLFSNYKKPIVDFDSMICGGDKTIYGYKESYSCITSQVKDFISKTIQQEVQKTIEEIYSTGKYDFKNGSEIDISESGIFPKIISEKVSQEVQKERERIASHLNYMKAEGETEDEKIGFSKALDKIYTHIINK